MQFNHPEVLYALFLLIIPIIVHLFQLRKFRKESFTNVKFLKRLTQQSRKSSQLKKWLVLATRLLLMTCIILAFARPYYPGAQMDPDTVETIIYLDNSYSMQATGQRGRLLERSVQELLEALPIGRNFTLITNDDEFKTVSRQELQEITYSANPLDFNSIFLKARSSFSTDTSRTKKLLLVSDFQDYSQFTESASASGIEIYAFPKRPESLENVSIDTLFLSGDNLGSKKVTVQLSYLGNSAGKIPVSIYNNNDLKGKSSVDFADGNIQELEFPLDDEVIQNGRIEVQDNGIPFDNTLYFTINEIQPIKVTSINVANPQFLKRIFSSAEFTFNSMALNEIDYNTLLDSQVIVLNELQDLPGSLLNTLSQLANVDVVFIIIPSLEGVGAGLQSLLRELGLAGYGEKVEQEKLVTGISFQHPLFAEVFEEEIRNFEYPKTQESYRLNGSNYVSVLSFEDNSSFLAESYGHYIFTAPLRTENSNFTQSPLVVPSFFNMGASALKPDQPYYILGRTNRIQIPVIIQGDQILQINSPASNFIPQQQTYANKVEIITSELPGVPGNYNVMNNDNLIKGLSFNVSRKENDLDYPALPNDGQIKVVNSLQEYFSSEGYNQQDDWLWKWFITFALIFLIIETLLLKYLK